jgi:type IV pilus assembly protein PilY1
VYGDTVSFTNCMAPLTEYMAEEDLFGDLGDGTQSVLTATIGFNVDPRADAFLTDAATMVKPADNSPAYYSTESADELTASFTEIILGILSTETTFTSPAVAVDTFTRTQSRDDVFFAMFEPGATADWWGNIKRLKLVINAQGEAEIKDADGQLAFNNSGLIKDTARSYWSTGPDGPQVPSGGVGAALQARTLSTRDILTNTGSNGALQALNTTNVNAAAYGMGDADEVYAFWLADDADDFADTIRWGWGYDVDDIDKDDNTNETRRWIMADILHSKPLVINYGALGSFTEANPDMRIVVGTNNGLLHMFNNADGSEDWAFFPKELGQVLTQRRKNLRSGKNVYGIDAPPVVYTIDVGQDGTLDYRDGDKVYLYFGLRRGGREYYALDISNPDAPAFMWSISPDTSGFSELGQTWSVPTIAKIPGYRDNGGIAKPVLIFGGGYDEVNDNHATFADTEADTMGRGVFIVDAVTGALVWSVTPEANSATNMQAEALAHAIAADVTTVDSNGDELIDRIYAADVGGNVWRIDLPGNTLPTSSQTTWFLTHLLDANSNTQTTDRRFFNAPDVVRTTFNGVPVDAVMIGSGDRTNPIAKDNPADVNDRTVDDQFYMIRDKRTVPYVAALDSDDCDEDPVADFRCVLPLDPAANDPVDLYDITANHLQFGTDEQKVAAEAALAAAHGWKLDLTADGEKALSRALTIAGKLFFTTFSPVADIVGCGFSAGAGRLYAIDMLEGGAIHDFDGNGEEESDYERSWIIGGLIPHTPSTYFGPDGQIWLLLPPGDSGEAQATGNPFKTGATLPGPYGSYWDRGDYP